MKNTGKYKFLYVVLILLSGVTLYAQSYTDDIKKITETFKKGDLSFHVKYCFYPYDSLNTIIDSLNASCFMSGNDYYCKISSGEAAYEYFRNSKYYFVVDHSEKALAVRKSSDFKQQLWDISKIDSLTHSPGIKISYKSVGESRGEYIIRLSDGVWNKIKIIFNTNTYQLEKMYLYSSSKGKMLGTGYNKPRIGIYYSQYSNKQLDKSIFSENKFFYDNKNEIVLENGYQKYKLLDYVYKLSKRS